MSLCVLPDEQMVWALGAILYQINELPWDLEVPWDMSEQHKWIAVALAAVLGFLLGKLHKLHKLHKLQSSMFYVLCSVFYVPH
jgi:hypothetical protein